MHDLYSFIQRLSSKSIQEPISFVREYILASTYGNQSNYTYRQKS